MGIGLGNGPIIYPVAGDVGLGIRIPHEGNSSTLGGSYLHSREKKRCDSGNKERAPPAVVVVVEDMIIRAEIVPLLRL